MSTIVSLISDLRLVVISYNQLNPINKLELLFIDR